MFQRNKNELENHLENRHRNLIIELLNKFKTIKDPDEAIQLLQETINLLSNVDKPALQSFIVSLRQIAEDYKFKYYKARCKYIIIPPDVALSFWVCYVLGSQPETTRFSFFEGEIQELLKILSLVSKEDNFFLQNNKEKYLPVREVETVLTLIKDRYPMFYSGVTKEPVLIPIMNFSVMTGSILCIPRLHCFGFFKTKSEAVYSIVSILHSVVHILHYQLTEDLNILPPGFRNLHQKLFEYIEMTLEDWAETFAEIVVASLLYDTEYMPLVAYMELCQEDQEAISNYLSWLEMIYVSSLQENIQKLIQESEGKLRA
jgi:hypothetical protein